MGNAQVLTLKLMERDRSQLISHWGQEEIPWSSRQVVSATCRIFVEVSLKCLTQQENGPMALCCNQAWPFQCSHSSAIPWLPASNTPCRVHLCCSGQPLPVLHQPPHQPSSAPVYYSRSTARHCPLTHCPEAAGSPFLSL